MDRMKVDDSADDDDDDDDEFTTSSCALDDAWDTYQVSTVVMGGIDDFTPRYIYRGTRYMRPLSVSN